jgi:hypothetical protein
LYIKSAKRYACHPSIEVEIPIFDADKIPSDIQPGELRMCKIDIRRDRVKGLPRYFVVDVE